MDDLNLGRLEPVDIDTVWDNEPAGFTPWLARAENLGTLGAALGLRLELEAQEMAVGALRADLVCRDVDTGRPVLIENQLGRSDHGHLGQTIAYAAGIDAAAVIWLARRFSDEHRLALGWLNGIAGDKTRFFGLEIELWKIDDSRAAPRFDVVSGPGSGAAVAAIRAPAAGRAAPRGLGHRKYWRAFMQVLDSAGGPITGGRRPPDCAKTQFHIGRHGFRIVASTTTLRQHVRVQLYVEGKDAKRRFGLLQRDRAEIEAEIGYALEWDEMPESRDCRVSCYLRDTDPDDEADWPRQHAWLAERANDMHRAFVRRIRAL